MPRQRKPVAGSEGCRIGTLDSHLGAEPRLSSRGVDAALYVMCLVLVKVVLKVQLSFVQMSVVGLD